MCRSCQFCMESCYWHLIEKRFCFDESIALYEEPEKEEKNNNMFDNMAFYDSVSVIAGRAIVTIDPLPIVRQPAKLVRKDTEIMDLTNHRLCQPSPKLDKKSNSVTVVFPQEDPNPTSNPIKMEELQPLKLDPLMAMKKTVSTTDIPDSTLTPSPPARESSKSTSLLTVEGPASRKRSLRERRLSKSLYLKLDLPKEIPIIRQNSMPKFFLDTPDEAQTVASLSTNPSTVLASPMAKPSGFNFDLYAVVQMEKNKTQTPPVPIHRESSRLALIKEKIKLKKSKSTLSSSNIPHTNYM